MCPTDRLAQSFLDAGAGEAGGRTLRAYDEFIGLLNEKAFRNALKSLSRKGAATSQEFAEARRLGKNIQSGLLALLFETSLFRSLVREYAVF